jgi:hypothetical protein
VARGRTGHAAIDSDRQAESRALNALMLHSV